MSTFSIASEGGGAWRAVSTKINTEIADTGAASVSKQVDKGIVNPAYILTMGTVPPATFFNSSKTSEVPMNGALTDAVAALHDLGERHNVESILLKPGTDLPGGLMFKGSGAWVTNTKEYKALGPAVQAIDTAARAVQELVD